MVELLRTISEVRAKLSAVRRDGTTVGLVPTMGAMHTGHGRLMEHAAADNCFVIASIFVNPTQFNRDDDYQSYPRDLDADLEFCGRHKVDAAFVPDADEMYPSTPLTTVAVGRLTEHLCGPYRPGHFEGVATVVTKLLNIVQPDRAYFGEKDRQQLAVIRRAVNDLNIPVEIVGVPTLRESDGLALSSRNQLLSTEHREAAPVIYRALQKAEDLVRAGETCPGEVMKQGLTIIQNEPSARVEYFEVVDPDELQPVDEIDRPVVIAGALWLGSTRLIDNVLASPDS